MKELDLEHLMEALTIRNCRLCMLMLTYVILMLFCLPVWMQTTYSSITITIRIILLFFNQDSLVRNKHGRVVSKRLSENGKERWCLGTAVRMWVRCSMIFPIKSEQFRSTNGNPETQAIPSCSGFQKNLRPWKEACMEARAAFNSKGFIAFNGKSLQGKAGQILQAEDGWRACSLWIPLVIYVVYWCLLEHHWNITLSEYVS